MITDTDQEAKSDQIILPEQILQGPVEFKTTATIEPLNDAIPKEKQIDVTDFLHILLSSLKDMSARPSLSFEKACPPILRKKAFSRDEIRRIKKKQDNLPFDENSFVEELKKKISAIPNFSKSYDDLLTNNK